MDLFYVICPILENDLKLEADKIDGQKLGAWGWDGVEVRLGEE